MRTPTKSGLVALLVAAALPALSVASGAAPSSPPAERMTFSGVMAQASHWEDFDESDPPVGEPLAVAVVGADATLTSHVAGSKPSREPQVHVVAWAMLMPGDGPGADPVPIEVWGATTDGTFTYDKALSQAALSFEATAEVVAIDETTGEEVPTGETFPVSVSAVWDGGGPLLTQRNHSWYTEPGLRVLDHGRSRLRMADAEVTVSTPDGIVFDGTMTEADIGKVKAATLVLHR